MKKNFQKAPKLFPKIVFKNRNERPTPCLLCSHSFLKQKTVFKNMEKKNKTKGKKHEHETHLHAERGIL